MFSIHCKFAMYFTTACIHTHMDITLWGVVEQRIQCMITDTHSGATQPRSGLN